MDLGTHHTGEVQRVRGGRLRFVTGLLLAGLSLACLSGPATDPTPSGVGADIPDECLVVEVIDRRSTTRPAHGDLIDAALRALGDSPYPLEALETFLGGAEQVTLLAGEEDQAPHPDLTRVVQDRLRVFRELAEKDAGAAVVVMAAPRLEGERYAGVTALLQERPPEVPVVLALVDLVHPREGDGSIWSWPAGAVVAGTDPVAVDRIALRILDSARRATGRPALEQDTGQGNPRLARAADRLGGCATLDRIDWRKVPLVR
jgi:hypothetical protein